MIQKIVIILISFTLLSPIKTAFGQSEMTTNNKFATDSLAYVSDTLVLQKVKSLDKLATTYYEQKEFGKAITAYNDAGILLTRNDYYFQAKFFLNKAMKIGESYFPNFPERGDSSQLPIATTHLALGVVYNAEQYYQTSLDYHFVALNLRIAILDSISSDVATSLGNIGNVFFNAKIYERAVSYHLLAKDIRTTLFGQNSPEVGQSYYHLASAYRELKQYDTAINYLNMALENKIIQRGEKHKDLVKIYLSLSETYSLLGNQEKSFLYKSKADNITAEP